MLGALAALLAPLLLGRALVRLAWPGRAAGWAHALLRWSLAFVLGVGASSCFFFLWLLLYGRPDPAFFALEGAAAALLALLRRRAVPPLPSPPPTPPRPSIGRSWPACC